MSITHQNISNRHSLNCYMYVLTKNRNRCHALNRKYSSCTYAVLCCPLPLNLLKPQFFIGYGIQSLTHKWRYQEKNLNISFWLDCNIFSSTTSGNLYGFIMGKLLPEEFSKPTKSIQKINTVSLLHPSTPPCFHGLTLKHTFSVTIPQVCLAMLFALLASD